ncbi:MAG TPA: SPOR domain-containing protein [Pyrinomonadaceae bacterium]|jgi:cell division septation protein DedD
MNYDFSLDKQSMGFLLAGSLVLCAVIFFAGLLVGANWDTDSSLADRTPNAQTKPTKKTTEEDAAAEPALLKQDGLRPTNTALRGPAGPAGQEEVAPPEEGEPEAARPSAAKPDAEAKVIQEAETTQGKPSAAAAAAANEAMAAAKPTAFAIQVGVFMEEEKANKLVEEMEIKGYTPSVFVASDAENRLWYSVRIGAYTDQAEATQAAASFAKQEKIKAVVRPLDSL